MKVYFNASLSGKEKHLKEYQMIVKTIHNLGHTAYADHVMNRDTKDARSQTKEQHESDYRKTRELLDRSDAVIIEATHPSIGLGLVLSMAVQMGKSVLVLYKSPETPHGLLLGDPDRLLTVKRYESGSPEKLKAAIDDFLAKARKKLLNVRFNLMIDKEQEEYLDLISRTKKISKSDFIRQLIDRSSKGDFR